MRPLLYSAALHSYPAFNDEQAVQSWTQVKQLHEVCIFCQAIDSAKFIKASMSLGTNAPPPSLPHPVQAQHVLDPLPFALRGELSPRQSPSQQCSHFPMSSARSHSFHSARQEQGAALPSAVLEDEGPTRGWEAGDNKAGRQSSPSYSQTSPRLASALPRKTQESLGLLSSSRPPSREEAESISRPHGQRVMSASQHRGSQPSAAATASANAAHVSETQAALHQAS